jgi:nucleotide-binding universal stress UspA family protein
MTSSNQRFADTNSGVRRQNSPRLNGSFRLTKMFQEAGSMSAHVLVPLDGSLFSEQALPYAYEVAQRMGARLHLVKVHTPAVSTSVSEPAMFATPQADAKLREDEAEYLARMAEAARWRVGRPVSTALLDGPVAPALELYVGRIQPTLVIMTTHGRGGFSRAWLGSVADELVRTSHVPVMLLRPHKGESVCEDGCSILNHIVIPLDGSRLAEAAIPSAIALGELTGAGYTLLQVLPPTSELPIAGLPMSLDTAQDDELVLNAKAYLESIANELRASNHAVEIAVMRQQPGPGILEYTAAAGADLVAMATHGRSGFTRLALGSVADKVLRGSSVPMLLLRPTPQTAWASAPLKVTAD